MFSLNSKLVSGKLKGLGIFLGWIAGLFLIAGLTWFLTRPVRTRIIIRNINSTLRNMEEGRQLEAPFTADKSIPRWKAGKAAQLGSWYSLYNSAEKAVVFSIMAEGLLAPYVIFVSPWGEMGQPIPLGAHSAQILDRLPQGVLHAYINRLAAGEAILREKK
ncbi:hypothetical protein [Treponema primitia]|uniref:hypothetical protein n=1 Tax=Treponema primitia TaxID=88058 RepID=UPI0002554E9F|nr:hypothetical protein [Treponema primitia]